MPLVASPAHELFVVMLGRIGPSNRPRVAQIVSACAHIPVSEAVALVAAAPCEIPFGHDDGRAYDLKHQIIEAGGNAQVEKRFVIAPILPNREVQLDAIGPQHVAVIKVVREHLDLGMTEAKHLIDSAPCVLVKSLEGGRAQLFYDALLHAGASARLI
jgi:ribosomal protein L7/L12